MSEVLLRIENLCVSFSERGRVRQVLQDLNLELCVGEALALVGETGSGKTVAALAALNLLATPPARVSGNVRFGEHDLLTASERELNRVRGKDVSMVFQEPDAALNPFAKVRQLMTQPLRFHGIGSARERKARALRVLTEVGIYEPERIWNEYPHRLNEGQMQRLLLAMALVCEPRLVVLDEPTAALDLPSRAELVEVLNQRRASARQSQLIITHDLGLVAQAADQVVVLYAGTVVERGSRSQLLQAPVHPYTRGLLASVPPAHVEGPPHTRRLSTIPGSLQRDTAASGCRFRMRCAYYQSAPTLRGECQEQAPALLSLGQNHAVRCHFAEVLS